MRLLGKYAAVAFLAAYLTMLAGCGANSESVSLDEYSLLEGTGSAALTAPYSVTVRLHGIVDSQGIVIRTSDVTYRPAVRHLWSGELADELKLILSDSLLRYGVNDNVALDVDVMKFNGSLDGQVEIDAWISAVNGRKTLLSRAFTYNGQQSQDGYAALVRELKRGWTVIADEVCSQLK